MMRGLVMDFAGDRKVWNVDDEYMFGPSFLVAPVTEYKATSRAVYLPAGKRWYDFYTGRSYDGGQEITATAPLERMPLFVKEGSIIPSGPQIQYTGQKPAAPITLTVYAGTDGRFELYEDDGTTNGYRRGAWSRIPLSYSEATKTLTIGARVGSFPGMMENRVFNIRWISGPTRKAINFDAKPDQSVRYSGKAIDLRRKAR
jgi:alpha-D-xyloside xylohydrolase